VAGIKVDLGWLTGYATTVEQAGDDLATALTELDGKYLTARAFGDVGRQLGTMAAYQNAADTLREQLSRAVDALFSAAGNLRVIAREHSASDQQQAASISAAHRS
jgi:uncharacterized protein YukE